MTNEERLIRWEPVPDLPDGVLNTVSVQYEEYKLNVTAIYAELPKKVRIHFRRPHAVKIYEEFSDDLAGGAPVEKMGPAGWGYPWPFQEVVESEWLKRVAERHGVIDAKDFRHCVINTFDVILHVMFAGEATASLLDG